MLIDLFIWWVQMPSRLCMMYAVDCEDEARLGCWIWLPRVASANLVRVQIQTLKLLCNKEENRMILEDIVLILDRKHPNLGVKLYTC